MTTFEEVDLSAILSLRSLYLTEMNTQIRYNACHERAWSDSYLIRMGKRLIGYISVKGLNDLSRRNTIFEYYLLPFYRANGRKIIDKFLSEHKITHIESQSNDLMLSSILHQVANKISSNTLLYEYGQITRQRVENVIFRKVLSKDNVFGKKRKDIGQYVLQADGLIVADGGFLLHYNAPFADIYMEVGNKYRRQGYGSLIVQELIKECFLHHRIPAARCHKDNHQSQKTLIKGGLQLAGNMLVGEL